MMNTDYRNARTNVIGAGTIATALTGKRYEDARNNALRVLAITGTVEWEHGKTKDWYGLDFFGNINEKNPGINVKAPRFDTVYRAHCDFYGLPHGTIYVPCYICGELFDAWTLDIEHVFGRLDPNGGTRPGGVLLADSGCNTIKHESRRVPHQVRDMLESSAAAKVGWSVMSKDGVARRNYNRRARRMNGKDQSSTPWQD